MKTFVTVEFKYNNNNYLFYGDTRKEVKDKIDNWMKDNNIVKRPSYNYYNKTNWDIFKYHTIYNSHYFTDMDMNFWKLVFYMIFVLVFVLYFYYTYSVFFRIPKPMMYWFSYLYSLIWIFVSYISTRVFYTLIMSIYTIIDIKRNFNIY